MQPTSVTVMLWRNTSVINKTNISGFTFFLKAFVYLRCLFVEIVVSWNNARQNYLILLSFTRCCEFENISYSFFWRTVAFQVVSPRVDDDCFWILFEGGNNIRLHIFCFCPAKMFNYYFIFITG